MKKFLSAFLSLAVALSLTALPASALELEDAKTLLQTYYVDPLPDEIWSLDSLDEILEAIGDPLHRLHEHRGISGLSLLGQWGHSRRNWRLCGKRL